MSSGEQYEFLASIGTDIDKAAQLILKGDIVAIPTETVYGLTANGLIEDAVKKFH